ncbi:MAG: ATP-dependent DNA helicase RecG [Cellvibrionaceae bacterium]
MTKAAQSSLNLQSAPLTHLKGVGGQLSAKFEKLGLVSLQDLLLHLPMRYEDRTQITPINHLRPLQSAVIEGELQDNQVNYGRRRSLLCQLKDHSGIISLRFYHFSASQQRALAKGNRLRCYGEVRMGASGLEIYHPEYQLVSRDKSTPLEQSFTPVYPTTEGMSQARLRRLLEQAFELARNSDCKLPRLLSEEAGEDLLDHLFYLHFPPKDAALDLLMDGKHPYQLHLIEEELSAYQASLLRLREQRRQKMANPIPPSNDWVKPFTDNLPFTLTRGQQRVCREIAEDLGECQPMMRLVQGDVGSGKTLVAAIAALQVIACGKQVALMAPTDILAEQHRHNFQRWLNPFGIEIARLSGRQKSSERRTCLEAIAKGKAKMVIGTHALFQEAVEFDDLALIIVDEQHRFGVHQRLRLRDKGRLAARVPHQLIMTATPIPRTLAMSAYADLDYSVIDELPKGRIPIETVVISQRRRPQIIERIRHACCSGRQAYWVCTLIEQSETLSAEAAEETAKLLQEQLGELNIALVHGRLKPQEKENLMAAFKRGEIQLLVATTVIEVGVDVPNASLMIIENPERLGLAQLHQLRGRVGRGDTASHCVLLYGDKLSENGKARLQAMRQNSDGFRIAEIDLELRGPGELLGTRQTGDIAFKLADLERDRELLPQAQQRAKQISIEAPKRAEALIQRWVGTKERFAQA